MKKPKVEIEVCERVADHWIDHSGKEQPKFHAQIKGEPGFWACGRSPAGAIGDLIATHPERFGMEITQIGKLPR